MSGNLGLSNVSVSAEPWFSKRKLVKEAILSFSQGVKAAVAWPQKFDVLGVGVSSTNYAQAVETIIQAALRKQSAIVNPMPVHGLIEACRDPNLNKKVNLFELVVPDGQPVKWALNRFHSAGLADRVYGPELTLRVCNQAAVEGIGVYLYGSTVSVLQQFRLKLLSLFPRLQIVGCESPPFRPLTPEEDQDVVDRINQSGAGLVFLGLGCPKQEAFAFEHRDRIRAVQLCVGAAFDFIAGNKKMAPKWMQDRGLEWLFRLYSEPKRLWLRYLVTNTIFLRKVFQALLFGVKSA